jgi:hypothetical protein
MVKNLFNRINNYMLIQQFLKSQFYKNKSPNLLKLGFDYNNNPESEFLKIQSMLYTEYHIKCESMLTLMKQFDIPSSKTMDTVFRLFDIEARSFSEANINAIMSSRSLPHTAKNTFTGIHHKSWFGETFYLRSTYEEEYANILDTAQIKYFVEHLRIKYFHKTQNRYRIAVPDFYLPESNAIVEVKSSYWLDIDEMLNKKEAYLDLGYKFHLQLDHKLLENW